VPAPAAITELLHRLGSGDQQALDELMPLVYDELHRIARRQRRQNVGASATFNTTALLHEAYLRFAQRDRNMYNHRGHFFAVAATAMRQVVIDRARKRLRQKRGGGERALTLDPKDLRVESQAEFLVSLDTALTKLGAVSPRLRQVVECRFFGGLTEEETSEALDVAPRTIRRDWSKAKAWLGVELEMIQ